MVDIYRSRKGYNYRCFYWKRDVSQPMDNEELIHTKTPDGVFYSKLASSQANDTQDIAGVFRVGTEGITIETQDNVNIDKDDLIQFDEKIWIAGRINSDPIQKNAEFGRFTSNKTIIELNKGI
jgi:hypothetical protein